MILTDADYTQIRDLVRGNPVIWADAKIWSLSKPTWRALFQAAENWFATAFNSVPPTSFKAGLDAVTTITVARAKNIGKIWFMWRIGIDW